MLEVYDVTKSYKTGRLKKQKEVVKGVSFTWEEGQDIAIIGESGSGKSTLGRMVLGLEKPNSGYVKLDGNLMHVKKHRKGKVSAVFQSYESSLHPYFSVKQLIEEPLLHKDPQLPRNKLKHQVISLLYDVGLDDSYLLKYPKMLSGGEAQRVAIARAISTRPTYLLLDEAISSLDMSIQVQVLDLLKDLKIKHHLSYLFITHDIIAAVYLCEDMMIFKEGKIQVQLKSEHLAQSTHPYVKQLIDKQLMNERRL